MPASRTTRILQRFNPTDAVSDFVAVWREAGSRRWWFLLAAAATTMAVFSLVVWEEHRVQPKPPEIVWINSWRPDRSDAEIRASNIAHQQLKEKETAEQAAREEEVRKIYKTLGRISGMDVDGIERRAKAEQAASEAAEAARAMAMQPRQP